MNVSSLSLRDLEYVLAVAEQRHFGKAAALCAVSQPALSAQIKKIEELTGLRIFERSRRHVSVAPQAEAFLEQVRVVLNEARRLVELVTAKREPLSGVFRLGVIATVGPYLLPHLIRPLRKKYPKLQLIIREGLTDGLLAELRAGHLDAVIASDTFKDDSLSIDILFQEPFLLAAPKDHPLMLQDSLLPRHLKASEMVLLEDGHCLKDQVLEVCPANSRGNHRRYHTTSLETLRHLVASGLGYTLMPLLAVRPGAEFGGLVSYRGFDGRPVGRNIILVHRKRYANTADIKALVGLLVERAPEGMLPVRAGR
ncbi:MAG: hypothetical protein A2X94_04750 [Bdellovibrionales bacterium GWB1_55_8]|nr:MAG: hypothetical protein A2X94_04750 [Bdellovibrionales bacterium GWB1_55_8]